LFVENREIFIPHLYLAPRRNFMKIFDADKTRIIGLPYGETRSSAIADKPRDAVL